MKMGNTAVAALFVVCLNNIDYLITCFTLLLLYNCNCIWLANNTRSIRCIIVIYVSYWYHQLLSKMSSILSIWWIRGCRFSYTLMTYLLYHCINLALWFHKAPIITILVYHCLNTMLSVLGRSKELERQTFALPSYVY